MWSSGVAKATATRITYIHTYIHTIYKWIFLAFFPTLCLCFKNRNTKLRLRSWWKCNGEKICLAGCVRKFGKICWFSKKNSKNLNEIKNEKSHQKIDRKPPWPYFISGHPLSNFSHEQKHHKNYWNLLRGIFINLTVNFLLVFLLVKVVEIFLLLTFKSTFFVNYNSLLIISVKVWLENFMVSFW
jgi:hypothetical protein